MSTRLDRTELQKNQNMSRANIEALVETETIASEIEGTTSSLEGKVGQAISHISRQKTEIEDLRRYAFFIGSH